MKGKIVLSLLNKPSIQLVRRKDAEDVRKLLSAYPSNMKKHKIFDGLSGVEAITLNKKRDIQYLAKIA